jgi:hypothetical protein
MTKTLDLALPQRRNERMGGTSRGRESHLSAPRSRQKIIEDICARLRPLNVDIDIVNGDLVFAHRLGDEVKEKVRRRLESAPMIYSAMAGVTNARAINTAAKIFRKRFQRSKLASLLKKTFYVPDGAIGIGPFEIIDQHLDWLEKIGRARSETPSGPKWTSADGKSPRHNINISKWLTAYIAKTLIRDFSSRPPTGAAKGPLNIITSLIHEYRTGQRGKTFERACDAVLQID